MKITDSPGSISTGTISCTLSLSPRTCQTIESFGASGAWWAQNVGAYTKKTEGGQEARDYVARLLFDKNLGIGLSAYRYNIGAGSTDAVGDISDFWRRAESFLTNEETNDNTTHHGNNTTSDNTLSYDWSRDDNAIWFLRKAADYGVKDITLFVNSPPVSMTKNGKAHSDVDADCKSNLSAENYSLFAGYILDVTEHFIKERIPVRYLSPINEPQWDWTGGQEGCHYEPDEMAACLKEVIAQLKNRDTLKNVSISAPESGEWGNTNYKYVQALLEDEELSSYFRTLDIHSYWSNAGDKRNFSTWLSTQGYNDITCRTSEWCEMKSGKDYSMDSAIQLAQEIHDDLTILNVTSWQYWIALSCYDYRDGLLYVNPSTQSVTIPKRFYAMGHYSKFVRPGYVRREIDCSLPSLKISAFEGSTENNSSQLVIVCVNSSQKEISLQADFLSGYEKIKVYVTDEEHSLECVNEKETDKNIKLPALSITTLCLK